MQGTTITLPSGLKKLFYDELEMVEGGEYWYQLGAVQEEALRAQATGERGAGA